MNRNILLLGAVLAQTSPLLAADVKPADPTAPVPSTTYRSAFEGYRSSREGPIADWRTLNEEVARVGGHTGIMRGATGHGVPANGKPAAAGSGEAPATGAPQAPAGGAHRH